MKSAFPALALIWPLIPALVFAQSDHLEIDTDEYHYTATFDSGRITLERLRTLLVFSPYDFSEDRINNEEVTVDYAKTPKRIEKGLIAFTLEMCIHGDPRYGACGRGDISDPRFLLSADVNVNRNDEVISLLDRLDVPPELRIIVQQFRDSLVFYSTVERRRLEYLRTGNVDTLSTLIGTIDPASQCAREIEDVELATTLVQRYKLTRYGWSNCLNSAWNQIAPKYPQQAWRDFLRAYGIAEQFTYKAVD